jgi:hypothetical protein
MKPRMLSVSQTTWAFYECLRAGDCENAADYYETLMLHYKERGKRLKKIRERYDYWVGSRGAYILSKRWLQELEEYVFKGRSFGLGNHESTMREIKKEREQI